MADITFNSPALVILLGPPGAGKGTHAPSLGSHLLIPHISTGDLFRQNICNRTTIGIKAKGFMDYGRLVPDEIVLEMLFARLKQEDCKRGAVLDGVPRTLIQARAIDREFSKTHKLNVILLTLDESLLVERICGRVACKQCGRPYHRKYDPPKNELCACGGTLVQRVDDSEEVLKQRLEIYRRQTEPLIEYYKPILQEIDGNQPKQEVFRNIIKNFTLEPIHA